MAMTRRRGLKFLAAFFVGIVGKRVTQAQGVSTGFPVKLSDSQTTAWTFAMSGDCRLELSVDGEKVSVTGHELMQALKEKA